MLYTIFTAVVLFLIFVIFYNKRQNRLAMRSQRDSYNSIFMGAMLQINELEQRDNVENYNKLEQGMQELEESYQQEIIGLEEQNRAKDGRIQELSDQLYNERNLCIDRQTVILFLNDELEEVKQAGLELQKHLDLHDTNCLPVLNLTEQWERDSEEVNLLTGDGEVYTTIRVPTAEALKRMDDDLAEAMAKHPEDFAD